MLLWNERNMMEQGACSTRQSNRSREVITKIRHKMAMSRSVILTSQITPELSCQYGNAFGTLWNDYGAYYS